jgi:hypothetical protein
MLCGQGDGLQEVTGQQGVSWERKKSARVLRARSGAGSITASPRISQTVEAATYMPSTTSSLAATGIPGRDSP